MYIQDQIRISPITPSWSGIRIPEPVIYTLSLWNMAPFQFYIILLNISRKWFTMKILNYFSLFFSLPAIQIFTKADHEKQYPIILQQDIS